MTVFFDFFWGTLGVMAAIIFMLAGVIIINVIFNLGDLVDGWQKRKSG